MELSERIRTGEAAIAKAKAQGRDVTQWECRLESLKLEAGRFFPGNSQNKAISCDVDAGEVVAVEIASTVLDADIWLAFRSDFDPGDGKAIFYGHELPVLRTKTHEELRAIHKARLAFGVRSEVRQ
jgi:hypothetical protein